MNNLRRELAPISDAAWAQIEEEASRTLKRYLAARRVVDTPDPKGVALAKWLARECDVLIVDEPTRGIDVGAKAEIYQLLDELACEGKALLVISSELPELLGLCGRILVMRDGRLVGEVPRADFSEDALMRLMAGVAAA